MTDKDLLLDYMNRFRLECHYRLDMVPGNIKELPIFMYKAAHESARDDMGKELSLEQESLESIDRVGELFLEKLVELDHYGKADDMIVEAIKSGEFSN